MTVPKNPPRFIPRLTEVIASPSPSIEALNAAARADEASRLAQLREDVMAQVQRELAGLVQTLVAEHAQVLEAQLLESVQTLLAQAVQRAVDTAVRSPAAQMPEG